MSPEERYQELLQLGLPPELAQMQVTMEHGTAPPAATATPEPESQQPSLGARIAQGGMQSMPGIGELAGLMPWMRDDREEPAAEPTAPSQEQLPPDLAQLLAGSTAAPDPLGGPVGQDPFTGGVMDIAGLIGSMSEDTGGRRQLFQESLGASPAFANAPSHVQSFLGSRFDPLEARYVAEGITDPGGGQDFHSFLGGNPQALGGEDWRSLFEAIRALTSGVQSADDITAMGMAPGSGGPSEAAYNTLRQHGGNILEQAVSANVHPALAGAVRQLLGRRLMEYGSAIAGAPSNQAEFVRQEAPQWEQVLAGR